MHRSISIPVGLLLLLSCPDLGLAQARFLTLGDLPGGASRSQAFDVSADGLVVVGESSSSSGTEAFRWTEAGGMQGLGDLTGGAFQSTALAVSADGKVVVGVATIAAGRVAFRWTQEFGMQSLGDLPGGSFGSAALGVSADGSEIVGFARSASGTEAFRWTLDFGLAPLGDLPGGNFDSGATGVSADGSRVVGASQSATNSQEAFLWTPDGLLQGLGDFPDGDFFSVATGISADGDVVIGFGEAAAGTTAFRWTQPTGLESLGTSSSPADAAGDGSVIVFGAGLRWTAAEGIRSLQDILSQDFGIDLTGSTLEASGISDDGETIVGTSLGSADEAFLAVVPLTEPGEDSDGDGVTDDRDNCTERFNPSQVDIDGDGYGNLCDGDFDQSLPIVGFPDLVQMRQALGKTRDSFDCLQDDGSPGGSCFEFDLDGNLGIIGFPDLARFREMLGQPPGPKCDACPLPTD